MKYRDEYMGEVKEVLNDLLNMTETIKIIRTDLLTDNYHGKNNDKIRSLIHLLCSYGRDVDIKARRVKFEIEKDEFENGIENNNFEIDYSK